jgi:membrane-associated phospholipid phosphatase
VVVVGIFDLLLAADREFTRAVSELRWEPATAAFIVLSAWWVKGTVFVAAGVARDVRTGRWVPVSGLAIMASIGLASLITGILKDAIGRLRPPLGMTDLSALVSLPSSSSFPSGHAATSFAAAVALSVLVPRLRVPALTLAALVALSRVYLGVHFWVDILAGAALGAAIGGGLALAVRAAMDRYAARRSSGSVSACEPPPARAGAGVSSP